MDPIIRPYRASDLEAVVETVQTVFAEYGFTWEPAGYCADLYAIEDEYEAFWVAELDGMAVGCVGYGAHEPIPGEVGQVALVEGVPRAAGCDCELFRLYVHPSARGHRLGRRLTQTVLDEARARGRTAIEMWSDKKLVHAHAMYQAMGARLIGDRICPGDPDQSPEWGFLLPL